MTANYEQWIANHQPTDPRGQCVEMTAKMAAAFPELRRIRGHYVCPLEGRRAHWWLVTAEGRIVDPTVEQFQSNGAGDYEEYIGPEPTGNCLNCGGLLFGALAFCNTVCAAECAEFCLSGGSISVNGRQVFP
jgi:hypothetical protein